jgi:N,N'-diacetyllegionaminate synthase
MEEQNIIIAEIGINHMGNMNLAHKLISDAAECGADIAKFQYYSCDDLFGDPSKPTYRPDVYQLVKPFELDEQKVELLMKLCDKEKIEFGCSCFDEERFNILEKHGIKSHKIASRVSKFDRNLAHKILNTGKLCFSSLGMGAELFDTIKYPNCKHLYCIAKYPTEYEEINFPKSFKDSIYYGFSSHAKNIYPSMVALSRGAKCIEVHFTESRSMCAMSGGFDHICSIEKNELKQLVDFSKQMEKLLKYSE